MTANAHVWQGQGAIMPRREGYATVPEVGAIGKMKAERPPEGISPLEAPFHGAVVATEMRLSVNLYFTKAARPMAAKVRGSHRMVAPNARFTASSPRCGGVSRNTSSGPQSRPLPAHCHHMLRTQQIIHEKPTRCIGCVENIRTATLTPTSLPSYEIR